jgi:hypothetical protein
MRVLLALLVLVSAQEDWWGKDWKHRRRIAVKNNLETELEAGYPILVEVDAEYLGLLEKSKKDLSDLALVHGGRRVPLELLPGRSKGSRIIAFRTARTLAGGATDTAYALYYGNPEASVPPGEPEPVFDLFEDFSSPDRAAKKLKADPELSVAYRDGALVIRDVPSGRTEDAPGVLTLQARPSSAGFALSFDLEIDSTYQAAAGFAVTIEMKGPHGDPTLDKEIELRIEQLGDSDYEVREKATRELVRLGKAAVSKLVAATRSLDAEVKWRAEHALREIRTSSTSSGLSAGVVVGDPQVGPIALRSRIAGKSFTAKYGGGWPLRLRTSVLRDSDGHVTVHWNNGLAQSGVLRGEVERITFSVYKSGAAPLGTLRLQNLLLRRHVDDESRPTHTLDVEENRP